MKTLIATVSLALAASAIAQTPATSGPKPNAGMAAGQGGQTAEQSFTKRDANKDHFLTKAEISGSRVESSFDKFDTNKDGKLSLAEYTKGRESMQGQGPQGQGQPGNREQAQGKTAEERFKERDQNTDGFLSKAEIEGSRMANRFDALDTNKDGKLSLNELKAGTQGQRNPGMGAGNNAPEKPKT